MTMLDWGRMKSAGIGVERAFEAFSVQVFALRCARQLKRPIDALHGAGGDGGVEAFCDVNGTIVGVQAKYFDKPLKNTQVKQLKLSFDAAVKRYPKLIEYVVCFPRNLNNSKSLKTAKSELDRWNDFVKWCARRKHRIELTKWGETEFIAELAQSNANGLYSIWFEKTLLTPEYLGRRYQTVREAYFKDRYLPDLHVTSQIENRIQSRAAHPRILEELVAGCSERLDTIGFAAKALQQLIDARVKKLTNAHEQQWVDTLTEAIKHSGRVSEFLVDLRNRCVIGATTSPAIAEAELNALVDAAPLRKALDVFAEIEKLPEEHWKLYSYRKAVERAVEANYDVGNLSYALATMNKHLVIAGEPGVGKSHAMVHALGDVAARNVPVVLVAAKGADLASNWSVLLGTPLDLVGWSLREILQALDAAAWLQDVKNASNSTTAIRPTRFIIAIDGLEEALGWPKWPERLQELISELNQFPRGRLVVSTRTSVSVRALGEATHNFIHDGFLSREDTDLPVMFRRYCEHFHIDYSAAPWIGWCLTNALSIRLFAQLYQGQKLAGDRSLLDWQHMVGKLCEAIDNECAQSLKADQPTLGGLTERILDALVHTDSAARQIEPGELTTLVAAQLAQRVGGAERADPVIERLRAWGLIDQRQSPTDATLSNWKTTWQLASQPIIDFVIGRRLHKAQHAGSLTAEQLKVFWLNNPDAVQVAANFLVNEANDLKALWKDALPSDELDVVVLRALATAPATVAARHGEWVANLFVHSMPKCRQVLGNLLIPLSRHPNHPFNAAFTDKILRPLKTAVRDLFWSGPDHVPRNQDGPWEGSSEQPLDHVRLSSIDTAETLPLLLAWGLATVVQERRAAYRDHLARWGKGRLSRIADLLKTMSAVDDTQVVHDVLLACLGAAVESTNEDNGLAQLAGVAATFFAPDVPLHLRHAGIRHTARMIVERAHRYGMASDKQVRATRPPYQPSSALLPVAPEGVNDLRLGDPRETRLLTSDLGWYVADGATEHFINSHNKKQDFEPKQLALDGSDINRVADLSVLKEKKVSSLQFQNGAIEAFVRNFGWDYELFRGQPNGEKLGEILGPDTAIFREYRPSTHGAKSPVMTYAEKYVWQAISIVAGNLAERIPFGDGYGGERPSMLTDYSALPEAVIEPFLNSPRDEERPVPPPRYVSLLLPALKIDQDSLHDRAKAVIERLKFSPLPTLKNVLMFQGQRGDHAVLAAKCFLHDLTNGIEALFWLTSAIIPTKDLRELSRLVGKDQVTLHGEPDHGFSSAMGRTYRSPTFVALGECIKSSSGYAIRTTSQSAPEWGNRCLDPACDENTFCVGGDEDEQFAPGELLRKHLDVALVRGGSHFRVYLNTARVEVARYRSASPSGGFQNHLSELVVPQDDLKRAMATGTFSIIWAARVLWQPHYTARQEDHNDLPVRDEHIYLTCTPKGDQLDVALLGHSSKS